MKVFLSQSGARSRAVAELLNEWLPNVIQSLQPWISVEISKGNQWLAEVNAQLGDAAFGILCVTKKNREAPWIMFESGALAKGLTTTRVTPLLIDMEPKEMVNPMPMFQATLPTKEDMWRLVRDLNLCQTKEHVVQEARVKAAFDKFWPDFETRFQAILKQPDGAARPGKSDSEMIAETLEGVRAVQRILTDTWPVSESDTLPGDLGTMYWNGSHRKFRTRRPLTDAQVTAMGAEAARLLEEIHRLNARDAGIDITKPPEKK